MMLEGGCAPYRACRSRLAIAVIHMVPSSASASTSNTTAGNQAGKLWRFQSEPGVKRLRRPPPIQLARQSGASDPRLTH